MSTLPIYAGIDDPPRRPPLFVDEPPPMPFRRLLGPWGNIAALMVLFVLLFALVVVLVAMAHAYGGADPRSIEIYKLIGIAAIVLGLIAIFIRQQLTAQTIKDNTKYLHDTSHSLHGAMNQTTGIVQSAAMQMQSATGEQVRAAEKAADTLQGADAVRALDLRQFLRDELRCAAKEIRDELKASQPSPPPQ